LFENILHFDTVKTDIFGFIKNKSWREKNIGIYEFVFIKTILVGKYLFSKQVIYPTKIEHYNLMLKFCPEIGT